MSMLKILTNPDPLLRQQSRAVDSRAIGAKWFKKFIAEMAETMLTKDGIGLAAPQVGQAIRLIVINTKDGLVAMINPEITRRSLFKEWDEEGCLSIPNTFGQVKRSKKIVCRFLNANGVAKRIAAAGLLARVIQHEIDHLDGVLFIDQAKDIHEAHEL